MLVASRSRFKALRAFTLDSALDQLNRDAQHRKDRGEDVSAMRSPISRTTSLDSVRGPPSARAPAPSLGDVQEHETFSIGDDDDDDETPIPQSDTVNRASAEDASSPRLSERARGKQPAVSVASTSRTPSTTSLPSLSTSRSPNVSQLQPSKEWLDSWLPQVQAKLEPILHIIDLAEKKQLKFKEYGSKSAATTPAATDVPSTPTKQSLEERRKATEPSELASKPGEEEDSHQADGEGGFQAERKTLPHCHSFTFTLANMMSTGDSPPTTTRPPTGFQWTAVAIGWYTALIWSRIYLSEAEAFQGPGGLYSSTDVRLFSRRSAAQEISLRSPRGAIDAVGDGLVKRISSMSLPTGAK